MRDDAGCWIALTRISGIGPARLRRLWEYFGDLRDAWKAGERELRAAGIDARAVAAIAAERPGLSPEREAERLGRSGLAFLTLADPSYPALLRPIDGAPACLYVRGSFSAHDELAIAVVGSRQVTAYGRQAALQIVADLAAQKVTIVSGLARGVDAVAHRCALDHGARTVAVLGCGLDQIYPPEHTALASQIAECGALVSEFPLGTRPDAPNFPMRNRIISGLSLGTLVIEAGQTSGALITATRAVEQNREVFAIPGSIFSPRSAGTNALIRRGEASLATSAADILEELRVSQLPQQLALDSLLSPDPTEERILQHLSAEPLHVDALTRLADLPVSVVSSTLTMLELRGLVRQVTPMQFVRAR